MSYNEKVAKVSSPCDSCPVGKKLRAEQPAEPTYNYGCPEICDKWVVEDCNVCEMTEDCSCKNCGCAECTLDARVACKTCAKVDNRCSFAVESFNKPRKRSIHCSRCM